MTQAENETRDLGQILASRIAAERKKAGFTQAGLAEKLGYSDKSVSKWERGDGIPDIFCLKRMSELFGVTVDALLTEDTACKTVPEASVIRQTPLPAETVQANAPEAVHIDSDGKIVFDMGPQPKPSVVNHWAIDAVTFVGIWLAGALCFLIGLFCRVDLSAILVGAWPVSLLVMLIFNSLWGKHSRTFWFCTGFIVGLLFFLCWILRAYSIWKLMWLSIPAAAIVWFSCRIHRS